MGSDMAMERIRINTEGVWEMVDDEQYFTIYRSSSYDGFRKKDLIWRGKPNEYNLALIEILVGKVPERPEPVFSKRTRILDIVRDIAETDYEYVDNRDKELMADVEEIMAILEEDN